MNRVLSKREWLDKNWLAEYDRTDKEKEEDYQRYKERAIIERTMFPDEDDDDWIDNQWF